MNSAITINSVDRLQHKGRLDKVLEDVLKTLQARAENCCFCLDQFTYQTSFLGDLKCNQCSGSFHRECYTNYKNSFSLNSLKCPICRQENGFTSLDGYVKPKQMVEIHLQCSYNAKKVRSKVRRLLSTSEKATHYPIDHFRSQKRTEKLFRREQCHFSIPFRQGKPTKNFRKACLDILERENDEDIYATFEDCIKARSFSKSCENIRWEDLRQSILDNQIEISQKDLALLTLRSLIRLFGEKDCITTQQYFLTLN
jgi:hypothetical protein